MTIKNKRLIIGIVVLIALLIGVIGLSLRGCGGPSAEAIRRQSGREIDLTVVCDECGAVYKTRMNLSDRLSGVCEKCGEGTVRRAVRCTRCGKAFAIIRSDAPDASAGDPRGDLAEQKQCPHCGAGSEYFGAPAPAATPGE